MLKNQTKYQYIIKKFDFYGKPFQWYIGNKKTYQTMTGGYRTIFQFSMALIFLLYSIIKLFKDRNGSFVMYDITYSELNNTDIVYFKDFEIFFFFKSSSSMMEMNKSIFQAYLSQINATDNSFMIEYPFEECDNNYFIKQLGFSDSIKKSLDKTYCINKKIYGNNEIKFSLSQISPLGEITNAVEFILIQTCSNKNSCTDNENSQFKETINSIKDVKIFIKTLTPNPLKRKNPVQNEVISFSLTSNFKGATIFFKNYNITTQSSLFPYIFEEKKSHFLSYDYYNEDYDDNDNKTSKNSYTFYLEFVLSTKVSFLEREYEQLDTILGNFIGVLNGLNVIGSIFTFIFDSFSKEIFIYNFNLKEKLLIQKNKKDNIISSSLINVNSNNDILINRRKDKKLLNLNNKSPKIKCFNLTNKNIFIEKDLKIKSKKPFEDIKSNDKIIVNNINEGVNKNIIINREENEIKMNTIKSFWCKILMILDIEESKYPDIQNNLDKIKLIHNFFDISIYINLIFDIIRLKKVIFNSQQLKLFESINFTIDEINEYLHKFSFYKNNISENIINQTIQNIKDDKNDKITENIISILKEQINI